MNQTQIDRFYLIYVLLVTILILGFAWVVFESRVIFAENSFSTRKQIEINQTDDSLSETAQRIIDITKRKIKHLPQFKNIPIQEI